MEAQYHSNCVLGGDIPSRPRTAVNPSPDGLRSVLGGIGYLSPTASVLAFCLTSTSVLVRACVF